MFHRVLSRVAAVVLAAALSLTVTVSANASSDSDDPGPSGGSPDSVVVIQTGVPDFFCDEGTGQHVILNPKGCYGTLYTYMDGRYIGFVNLAAFRASQGPSAWDSFTRLYNAMYSFCTGPVGWIPCQGVPAVITYICKRVFGGEQSVDAWDRRTSVAARRVRSALV